MTHQFRPRSRDDEDGEDEEIQYGIRRPRDRTTYEYRESSALNSGEFMNQEASYVCYSIDESWLLMAFDIAEITAGAVRLPTT